MFVTPSATYGVRPRGAQPSLMKIDDSEVEATFDAGEAQPHFYGRDDNAY